MSTGKPGDLSFQGAGFWCFARLEPAVNAQASAPGAVSGLSLHGAPWLQPVAISGKSREGGTGENKRNPLLAGEDEHTADHIPGERRVLKPQTTAQQAPTRSGEFEGRFAH